jgi:hypothetical protein
MREIKMPATDTSPPEAAHSLPPALTGLTSADHRIIELERENSRLQRLVAELLLKNQQLRKPSMAD